MTIAITKPILRNDDGYLRPAGQGTPKKGSFVEEYGFGGEEWNHRPDLSVELGGQRYKIFSLEAQDIFEAINSGDYTSDDKFDIYMTRGVGGKKGPQEIIARARNCTLIAHHAKKNVIFRKLEGFMAMAAGEAWAQERVRKKFGQDEAAFRDWWAGKEGGGFHPGWMCPYDDYVPFTVPIPIVTMKVLTDRNENFVNYYNRHSRLDEEQARKLDRYITRFGALESALADPDGTILPKARLPKDPTVLATVAARRGQQAFRARVEEAWDRACAVTGSRIPAMLRASHIIPWKDATHEQKFDVENGLLLCANHDALFDRGLLSYAKDGSALVSSDVPSDEWNALGLEAPLRRKPGKRMRRYLKWHRQNRFQP